MVDWIPEIEAMIVDHHKVTPSRANQQWLVESFRRADWIDVSRGLRKFASAHVHRSCSHHVAERGLPSTARSADD